MDLVRSLNEDPDERLTTLKEIRLQLIQQSTNAAVLAGNLKKLILGIKQCLAFQQSNMFRTQIEAIHEEAMKVIEQLIYKNDPDLEIHFFLILPSLIQLLESDSNPVKDSVVVSLKLYCQMTANVEQVLAVSLKHGVENDNPHIRHEIIKALPEFIQYGIPRKIERTGEFRKCIEVLLIRARGDNTDSIRLQAQTSIREIIQHFKDTNFIAEEILPRLTPSQREQLMVLAEIQSHVVQKQQEAAQSLGTKRFEPIPPPAALTNTAVAFGVIPLQLVQHIQKHSDWMMKLKSVEDLEHFLLEMSSPQTAALMNFSSAFISFVQEYLIEDDHMKIILAGVRILKLIMRSAQMAEKTNMTRLIQVMIIKLNDPKEVVRVEIESFFTALSYHMKTRSLVLTLLQQFKTYRTSNECKQSILRSITSILLTQNGTSLNDLQRYAQVKEDNMWMQLVEPVAYLYCNPQEPTLTRYYAQECLATMASTLQRSHVLEALYECLSDDRQLYDQFCDRIDAQLSPFLVNGGMKVEYPLPMSHVFSVKANTQLAVSQVALHPRRQISDKKQGALETFIDNQPNGPQSRYSQQSRGSEKQEETFSSEFKEYLRDTQSDTVSQGYYVGPPGAQLKKQHSTGGTPQEESAYHYNPDLSREQPSKIKVLDQQVAKNGSKVTSGRVQRRPLGEVGRNIIEGGANFKVEMAQSIPVQQAPVDISERLRILKARNQIKGESGDGGSRLGMQQPHPQMVHSYGMQQVVTTTSKEPIISTRQHSVLGSEMRVGGQVIGSSPAQRGSPTYFNHGNGKDRIRVDLSSKFDNLAEQRTSSPPFYSQFTPENPYETPQIYTTKFQNQGRVQDKNAIPPHASNFARRMMGGGSKPSYYQRFAQQGSPQGVAQEIQTSKQILTIPKEEFNNEGELQDGKMSHRSDFSRGSALTNSIQIKGPNKKLQSIGPYKPEDPSPLKRQGSQIEDSTIKQADLKPLDNPAKSLNSALLDIKDENNWEKQNGAINAIRQALKFNPEKFTRPILQAAVVQLVKAAESLRSLLSKNAIQALQECYQALGKQMDAYVDTCSAVILKKCGDTNVFISEAARFAIEEMCLNCNEAKLMQTLLPQAKHKNPVVRCQIARCFECVIKQLGPALAESTNCDSIISALSNYISDSSPEVRFNARNAILALEYGPNPVGGRELNERLIRKALKAEADQNKVILILQEGIQRQKTLEASLQSFISKAKSSIRQNSQSQFPQLDRSPSPSPLKKSASKAGSNLLDRQESFAVAANDAVSLKSSVIIQSEEGSLRRINPQPMHESIQRSQVFNDGASQYTKKSLPQSYGYEHQESEIRQSQVSSSSYKHQKSQMNREMQEQIQRELTNTLSVLLKQQAGGESKKFALLSFAEAALKQKELLLQSPLFQQALNQVVVHQLMQAPPAANKLATQNLVEAEILNNLLEDVHVQISADHISQIVRSIAPYLGSTNAMAKKNAENLIAKVTAVYQARDICQALSDTTASQGQKGKAFLVDNLSKMVHQIGASDSPKPAKSGKASPQKSPKKAPATLKIFNDAIFPAVYKLMDEYMAGRGKHIPPELKTSIEKLIKVVFDQHGSGLMEGAPANKLPKILEIVQKGKERKLAELQKAQAPVKEDDENPFNEEDAKGADMPNESPQAQEGPEIAGDSPALPDRQHSEYLRQMEEQEQRELTNMIPTGRQLRRSDIDPPIPPPGGVPPELASLIDDENAVLRQKSHVSVRQSLQGSLRLSQQKPV